MTWTPLDFGKHKGKSLPQALFDDPDWFFWIYKQGAFDGRGPIQREARIIHARATSIIPPPMMLVEYVIHHPTNKFLRFDLVESSRSQDETTPAQRFDVIDMSYPQRWASYDKRGCASLVKRLKRHFFGKESARMTKERCEAFFDDLKHFRNTGE